MNKITCTKAASVVPKRGQLYIFNKDDGTFVLYILIRIINTS